MGVLAPEVERQLAAGVLGRLRVAATCQLRLRQRTQRRQRQVSEALAGEQQPFLKGRAARQAEAGQELAPIQRDSLFEIVGIGAGSQARKIGGVEGAVTGGAPLDGLARDAQERRSAAGIAERLAQPQQRLERLWRAASSVWSGQSSPHRLARLCGRSASTAR